MSNTQKAQTETGQVDEDDEPDEWCAAVASHLG